MQGGAPGHRGDLSCNNVWWCWCVFLPLHTERSCLRQQFIRILTSSFSWPCSTSGTRWRSSTTTSSWTSWGTSSYACQALTWNIQRLDTGELKVKVDPSASSTYELTQMQRSRTSRDRETVVLRFFNGTPFFFKRPSEGMDMCSAYALDPSRNLFSFLN